LGSWLVEGLKNSSEQIQISSDIQIPNSRNSSSASIAKTLFLDFVQLRAGFVCQCLTLPLEKQPASSHFRLDSLDKICSHTDELLETANQLAARTFK
jgi:hypothetical protein